MQSEPPPGYVAFVARHLESLRREAARAVGDEADRLYPDVLMDVATRWRWLDLLHTRLGRPDAGERYLRHALDRRSQRWHTEQAWQPEQAWPVDIQVTSGQVTSGAVVTWRAPRRVSRSSAALRMAPHLTPAERTIRVGALAEAAIAWWHAYEARRRRKLIAAAVVLFMLFALLTRLREGG